MAYHFTGTEGLLTAALAGQTEELVAAAARRPGRADLGRLDTELVGLFTADRGQVLAGYELYLPAGRPPAAAAPGGPPLAAAGRRAGRPAQRGRRRVAAAIAVLDGWFVQHLVLGTSPVAADLEGRVGVVLAGSVLGRRVEGIGTGSVGEQVIPAA